jgi:hypothetical protein
MQERDVLHPELARSVCLRQGPKTRRWSNAGGGVSRCPAETGPTPCAFTAASFSVGATTIRPSVGLSAGRVAPDPGVSARCIHADAGVDCLDFVGSAHVTV